MNLRRRIPSLPTSYLHRLHLQTPPPPSIPIPHLPTHPPTPPPNFPILSNLLSNPSIQPGPHLETALSASQIIPTPSLLLHTFSHFDSSPKLLLTLFNWAREHPGYVFSIRVLNGIVDCLGKGREFDVAWCLILDCCCGEGDEKPGFDTFSILIRRYTRAGLPRAAIRTFEYASSLDFFNDSDPERNLFVILLDSLCKEGHVRIASEYFDKHKAKDPNWSPPIRIYNVLLNGWLRSRKIKHAERLWAQMKKENVKPTVVTYGTLVEGLCRMGRHETALELLDEMKTVGVKPNVIVYNPIIDALGEAGRFKEALGMLERFSILETGPTISTYNSLVKGFCKAGDLAEASKILRMMIDSKCLPTLTTYGYFFKSFSKTGNIELGLSLYTKLIRAGYEPDRLIYHLLVKMLCKEEKLDLLIQIIKEMRAKGFDLDLASSTMLIHLLCKMRLYDEAFNEFQDMFRRGIVPQQLTYKRMCDELEKRGMTELVRKVHDLMASVPHSTKLPNTYKEIRSSSHERRISVIKRAEAASDVLKTCRSPRELVKLGSKPENFVFSAQKLTDDILKKLKI